MFLRTSLCLAAACLAAWASPAPAVDAVLGQYCLACHNSQVQTGGVSVEGLDLTNVANHAATFEKVLRKVRSGEMPPPGMPAPEPPVAQEFSDRLAAALDAASRANPNPGRIEVHRLNRAEYSNAVRDLFALDIDAGSMLPADDSGHGFDNIADVLSLSPVRLERYMTAARRVASMAVGDPSMKPSREKFERDRETGFLKAGYARNMRDDLPFGAEGGASLRFYFPLDADYKLTFELDGPEDKPNLHEVTASVQAGMRTLVATFPAVSAKPEVAVRSFSFFSRGGGADPTPLDVRLDGRRLELIDLREGEQSRLRSIVVEGPLDARGPGDTPSRRRIFSCRPSAASEEEPCAREILSRLARQAYRRPVTRDDVSALMAIFALGRQESFESGVEKAIQAMLVSPQFLFRVERDPGGLDPGDVYRVSDLELASRLSFFLWSSLPDEELLSLAERNRLHEPAELAAQVRRMLADDRSRALVENFAGQWLYLRNVATHSPDAEVFPQFDADLRQAMQRETELFFQSMLRADRSVVDLLDADYTYLNERLAKHYGVDGVRGSQFRRVAVSDPNRGGLLGQASILTVTSYPNRTSVVQRGKWILENLFGMPPPPPPADVPSLEDGKQGDKRLTLREAMELHRANPTCAGCHSRMDPVGFALENFDAIGRWREKDGADGIDASGEFPDGTTFDGPAGLKRVLLAGYREPFAATVTEKLLTYGLGRGVEYYDKPAVRAILREAAEDDYRWSALLTAIVKSAPFQMRRTPES